MVALAAERTTGLERYSIELVRALRQLAPSGIELVVYAPAWAERLLGDCVVPPGWLARPLALEAWLPARVRRDRLDLLHTTAFAPGALSGVPVVLTLHDLVPWEMPETMSRGQRMYFRPAQERLLRSTRLQGVVTDAECTAEDIRRRFGVSGPTRSAAVGLGDHWSPASQPPTDDADRTTVRLLTVGTLEPRKGLHVVERCLSALQSRGVDVEWSLVGRRGWSTRPPHGIVELGSLSDHDLLTAYRASDALVAPSLLEGFDLPVLEALACGTAVVASDIPVHREHFGPVVRLARAGDPQETADQVLAAVTHDTGDTARQARVDHARGFTWQRTAEAVVDTWRCALTQAH